MVNIELVEAILSIVLIDLVLSGDNAVVIGMACRHLPPAQRRRAILLGAAGAIGLRVLLTALIAILLRIPLLQATGGLALIWIGFRLLEQEEQGHGVEGQATLFKAVRTLILADVIMSLDNVLAIGGASHGDILLLLFGLGLSIPLIIAGSGVVAMLMNRLPWLIYVGAGVLVYTAAGMILEDPVLHVYRPQDDLFEWSCVLLLITGTLGLGYRRAVARQSQRKGRVEEAA